MNDATQSALQAQDVLAPAQPEGATAVLRTWLKKTGDSVVKDEPVAELETDKVVVEVFAPCDGVLQTIAAADSPVQSDTVLGRVLPQAVETTTEIKTDFETGTETKTGQAAHAQVARTAQPADRQAAAARQTIPAQPNLDQRLSPAVRQLIAQHDVDPTRIHGTGRGGRLTREDVLKAIAAQTQTSAQHAEHTAANAAHDTTNAAALANMTATAVAATAAAKAAHPTAATRQNRHAGLPTQIPHSPMRRRIAQHMQQSLATAPHVTAIFEADLSAILRHRAQHKPQFAQQGVNLTLTAYFVSAAAAAMHAAPTVNSRWRDDYLEVYQDVNVGVGTALGEQGLIVPVIHNAQHLSLLGIATRLQTLTQAARNGTLKPEDVQHGTFTISNYGGSGALVAAPIVLNQGQAAILGIGAIQKRVVVADVQGADSIQIRPMAYVSLTIDHRVLNGDQANAWLTRFVQAIEDWNSTG